MRSIEELKAIAEYILEHMTDSEKAHFPNMTREEKGLIIKYGNSRT